MKALFLLLSLLLFPIPSISQSTGSDSTSVKKALQRVENILLEDQKVLNAVHRKNDSLNRELLYYRAKEDYFSDALSDQASRFGLIVTGLLALVALASYGGFKWEVQRIQKESDKKTNELVGSLEDYEKRFLALEFHSERSTANLFVTIAANISKDIPVHQLLYRVKAALHHGKAYQLEEHENFEAPPYSKKNYGAALVNIRKAEKITDIIIADLANQNLLEEQWDILKRDLDIIINLPSENLKEIAIKIRYQLKDFLNEKKTDEIISPPPSKKN